MSKLRFVIVAVLLILLAAITAAAQSTATIRGTVADNTGAALTGAQVTVRQTTTNIARTTQTDSAGAYQFPGLPIGPYEVVAKHQGFQSGVRTGIVLNVNDIVPIDFSLKVGSVAETLTVEGSEPLLETTTINMGDVIDERTVQQIPLNGRHFVDLTELAPGTVTPPQNGFLTAPLRGQGSFGVVTAGNREDTVNFMINGINLNDIAQNQITFQPSINTVSEFRMLNSTYSAEYGHTSGTIVNIATRSGTNTLHGEAFDFVRNDMFDAKNFFDNPNKPIPPFKRNDFGAALGGPVYIPGLYDGRNKTFWFFSYEGLRQRQGVTFNTQVPTDADRATVTDPVSKSLLPLIPEPIPGTNTFAGSGSAPVNINQWTVDVDHQIGSKDTLHGYYALQHDLRQEPAAPVAFSTIPGFGDIRQSTRQILTFNEVHTFSPAVVNEARLGFNRIHILFNTADTVDPSTYGFTGLTTFGPPEIFIQSLNLDFGGERTFPQGRGDTTGVFSDTLSWLHGNHSLKFGGELRREYNNNIQNDVGLFIFGTFPAFASGSPTQFQFLQGGAPSQLFTSSYEMFVQDNYKLRPNFTLELGFRYELNTTPTERKNRLVAFDAATDSLRQVGSPGFGQVYPTNHNFMPRVGFTWDPFRHGTTSIRGGYGIFYDQPVLNSVSGMAANPPFASTLVINSPPSFGDPFGGQAFVPALSPSTIDPNYADDYVQDWELSVQHELTHTTALTVAYVGSKGTHLRLGLNQNQPIDGVLPFPTVTLPDGTVRKLNVIAETDSVGNSSYNSLWVTLDKRLAHGLELNGSYAYSHSFDDNSRSAFGGQVPQDSYDPAANRGPSDFDVRHRFVLSYLYTLPFKGNRLIQGWQTTGILSLQTGNPLTIFMGGVSPLTNLTQTVRPDVVGNPFATGQVFTNWFNPVAFAGPPAGQFGDLGRNSVIEGPGFQNLDFSLIKETSITERMRVEFRTEFFNIFNHPNFGQPGGTCSPAAHAFTVSEDPATVFPALTCIPNAAFGTITDTVTGKTISPTTFGVIRSTRFPTGDSGSARQIQFALKFKF